ncbi:FtsK/SpoIIIE domain-containing protein [Nonomuraea sp. NPDC048916]|uniref:FtsK/SpoIIIE domain-containing protein n=1 Tax=Nonomuraea sp. NPDC048916 TaxID=3154232 RepID=UPI0034069FB6
MRIMLTVLGEQGDRDVVVDGDDAATVAGVSEALSGQEPLAKVVRLPRARAPYGMSDSGGPTSVPNPRRPEPGWGDRSPRGAGQADAPHPRRPGWGDPGAGAVWDTTTLWRNGRPLDPRAPATAVLRDGDKVTLDPRLARSTIIEEPGGVAEVRVVGGPAAGAVHRLGLGVHVIGSDPMCAIAVADPMLAPEAVTLRVTPDAITAEAARRALPEQGPRPKLKGRWAEEVAELTARVAEREAAELSSGSWQGPELDARPLTEAADWPEHAVLTCGSSVFTLTAIEPRDAHLAPRPEGGVAYNRPPRLRRTEGQRAFKKPQEPRRTEGMRLQLLAAFLPAVVGVTLSYVLGQWYFLLFAVMTPVIMIGQWWSDRRHGKKQHRKAAKEFKERLEAYEATVERARAEDELERRADAPDPAQVLLTATGPRRRLWERRIHDPDALRLRVGLADLPANLELTEEQGGGAIDPPICRAVPVALAMRRLGVAGVTGPRDAAVGLAGWLIGQAATLHSPRDLAIVVLSAHTDGEHRWGWVRWLPHCAPRGGEDCVALVGTDPESAARRVAELASLIDERQNTAIPELGKIPTGWDDLGGPEAPAFSTFDERPYDVLVVLDGAQVLRGLPGMPQVLRQGPRNGVYTLAIDDDQRLLPEECATVAACGSDGLVRLRGGGLDVIGPVLGDLVSPSWCDRLARALAPIRDVSRDDPSGNLPGAVRLLDLLGLRSPSGQEIAARWHDRGSTKAVIGVGPEGRFSIDLGLDGPHGLIAGTTGAGKSELLQTLICSLAVANRPDQLTFVLIDYKGGAAFKECVRLPHTVGMVSDLDGHLTQRALDSLAAEVRRRERLLLAAGAKDIDDYTGDPLPRLVLIIDEFAALVAELPDFVAGLVDIARRGRSLGIHLILATQRPAGVVTADIQANTSLRIALRVTEPMESTDVIDLPDAAHISKSTPGRCYVKSGVGAATAVQTARVGGRSPLPAPSPTSPRRRGPSGTRLSGSGAPGAGSTGRGPKGLSPYRDSVPGRRPGAGPTGSTDSSHPGGVPGVTRLPGLGLPRPAGPSNAGGLSHAGGLPGVDEQFGAGGSPGSVKFPGMAGLPGSGSLPGPGEPSGPGEPPRLGDAGETSGMAEVPGEGWLEQEGDFATGSLPGVGRPGGVIGIGRGAEDSGPVRVIEVDWRSLGRALPPPPEPTEESAVTDLSILADAVIEATRLTGVRRQPSPWLDPLPTQFVLDEAFDESGTRAGSGLGPIAESGRLASDAWPAQGSDGSGGSAGEGLFGEVRPLAFGITDRPWAQDRRPLVLDLSHGGHLLIAGAARSGRSTALRTIAGAIAAQTSPADVHVHAIDCGSGALLPLVAMPHCGAVVTRDQLDRVERLLARLRAEVGRRQQLLAEAGHASLAEYRQAGHRLPWLVFMLDRWEGFVAAFEGYDYGRLPEALLQLLREGPAVGLRAVVTGDRSSLMGQVSTVFDDRLILRLADPSDYGLAGLPVKGLPSSIPPGRALSLGEHGIVEHQIALLSGDPSGPAQVAALQSLARALTSGSRPREGERPLRVDALPVRITASQTFDLAPGFRPPSPLWALIGAGGDSLAPQGIDLLAQGPGAVIAGPARSGRSSTLLTAARSLISSGTPVIAVAPRRSPLRTLEGTLAVLDGNADQLQELVAGLERYVVLVDDAELVNPDSPLGLALDEVLRSGRDGEHGLIIAGTTGDLATSFRGFTAETRKSRTGLLLSVQSPSDGDLFTIRLPRGAVGGPPGRGLLVTAGATLPVQAALPDPSA